MKSLEHYYRNLAIQEPHSSLAQEYLWVAQRCNELSVKNEKLSELLAETAALPPVRDPANLTTVKEHPKAWYGNHPPQIEYIRRVAQKARNPRANWVLLQAAEDVLHLLARNRALRDVLSRYVGPNKDRAEWAGWVAAYRSEVERQAECYCILIDDLPSICRYCRPYCGAHHTTLRDVEGPVARG